MTPNIKRQNSGTYLSAPRDVLLHYRYAIRKPIGRFEMADTAATAHATAQKFWGLAKFSRGEERKAYFVMMEWWEQRAAQLGAVAQIKTAAPSRPDIVSGNVKVVAK